MIKKVLKYLDWHFIDFIPVISGLIGKIALTSSFAFVWAQELNITAPNFVFDNIRIELIIGSIITLIMVFILPNASPAGTLAPLIVLIPNMVSFGVHPLILSIMVGIIGIIVVKAKLLEKLILISGHISKTSLTIVFGVSGVLLSFKKLLLFFGDRHIPLFLLIFLLVMILIFLSKYEKNWLIIPIAATVSVLLSLSFGIKIDFDLTMTSLNLSPIFWWNDMWGIGFGFDIITVFKTIPFALFIMLLWAMDTASINAAIEANFNENEKKDELDIKRSFYIIAVRNIIGGFCGGAQTSSLWRSFLIPLFMIKRPIRSAAIMLGILGIIIGFVGLPIRILSFPPLVWSVLLFGIFVPFFNIGIKNFNASQSSLNKIVIIILTLLGIAFNPILSWVGAILYEKKLSTILKKSQKTNKN